MKMKLTLLLLASVFFVSCGMPTIFNLTSGEYYFQQIENPTSGAISSSFKLTNADTDPDTIATLLDSKTQGPSLMFFYTISGSNLSTDYTIGAIQGALVSAFSSHVKKEPFGVNNPIYHELVYKTLDDTKVSLYEFKGTDNQKFGFPNLILTGKDPTVVPKLDSFTLQAIPTTADPSRYYIELRVDTEIPSNSFTPTPVDLYGFEGSSFVTNPNDISSSLSGEYVYLPDGASEIFLNIFSAFSVLGDFTNIYWSELNYIGQIKLPLLP